MKAADFDVVAEARRVAQGQLDFFGRMMAAKAANAAQARQQVYVPAKPAHANTAPHAAR